MNGSYGEGPTVDGKRRGGGSGPRRYRVLFRPAGQDERRRPGVIVARDWAAAHREASQIAHSGGEAEVRYIGDDGARTLARYPAHDAPPEVSGDGLPPALQQMVPER